MELNKKIETLYQKKKKTLSPETKKRKNKIRRQVLMESNKRTNLMPRERGEI